MMRTQSRKKYSSTAARVPTCKATSKARECSGHPRSCGTTTKCAELLTGRNSVKPWMTASTITWYIGIGDELLMVAQRILVAASLTIGAMAWGQSIEGALRIVCPDGKISRSPGGRAVGCRSCPAGTGLSDVPGIGWDLQRAIMGHFTSAGAQNLVLSGRGCEPHSLHRSEEHTSELQSPCNLVCRLLLEKK